jgi:transcriptional adapter 2-alpha
MEKKKTKEERDLAARLKIFARFHAPEEHEALVTGLLQARKLRGQIELYQNYRKLGIRSLEEAREYEIDRKKREEELKSEKHRKDAGYIFETGRGQVGKPTTSRRSRLEDEGLPPSKKQKDCKALDLSTAPLADMLTDKELALCQSIPMLPSHYLAVKEAIVR